MKLPRIWLVLAFALLPICLLQAQDTLYYENFETGGGTISRNTTDLGGATSGSNQWWINNVYTGGSGTFICLSFPFTYTIANTPVQPSGIFNNPNGFYLHTLSNAALTNFITCSSFIAADGFCTFNETNFAKMTTPISTLNRSGVTLSFWWNCGGGTNIWGEIHYSTNGGTSWTQVTSPISQYKNQTNWVQQTISLPAFDNQAQLQFGFRFSNSVSTAAQDPGFSIDDIVVTAAPLPPAASIVTDSPAVATAYCSSSTVPVVFTATGTYQSNNVFLAQLSDPQGSFASPTVIGSLPGTTSGTIQANLAAAGPGTGYRIRVVSNNPPVLGSDNGADLTIVASPGLQSLVAIPNDTVCSGEIVQLNALGTVGTLSWSRSTNGGQSFQALGVGNIPALVTQPLYASQDYVYQVKASASPCPSDSLQISLVADSISASFSFTNGLQCVLTDASFGAVSWAWDFGDGNQSTVPSPTHTYSNVGNYLVTLVVTSAFGCTDSTSELIPILVGLQDLAQAYGFEFVPNPFSTSARIALTLPESRPLTIRVLDLQGKEVDRLYEGNSTMGESSWTWTPSRSISPGIYFMEVRFGDEVFRRKILRI